MFERFTGDARTVVIHAQEHARRLGHRYIGCEHLLLALTAIDAPAGAVLREHGLAPERVEEEIARHVGLGAAAALFADLDRDALAAIGVDLDAVRARIEASFAPESLTRAGQTVHWGPAATAACFAAGAGGAAPDAAPPSRPAGKSGRHLRPADTARPAHHPPGIYRSPPARREPWKEPSAKPSPATIGTSTSSTSPSA